MQNNHATFRNDCQCHRHQNGRKWRNQKHCHQSPPWWDEDFNQNCCDPNCSCHKKEPCCPKPEKVCDCKGVGIQAILKNSEAVILENDDNVLFDTVLHQIGHGFTYNDATGEFIIHKPGDYKISWGVIVGGANTTRFVNFGIKLNGKLYSESPLPVTAGQLSGDVILSTKRPRAIISLFNNTTDSVRLSRHLPSANLVITNI